MELKDLENRFMYHKPKSESITLHHEAVRGGCLELSTLINNLVPECREKTLAITKLEEVMMWANAGIARNS